MRGVALMALGWLWWRAWVSVDAVGAAAFGVAGVALGDMDLHFAWQAWHLWHWAGSGGALGLGLVAGDAAALCLAGVAHHLSHTTLSPTIFDTPSFTHNFVTH